MSVTGEFEAIIAAGWGLPLDLEGWRARLEQGDPGLLTAIAEQLQVLEGLAPTVTESLRRVEELSSRFCVAFAQVHPDPDSMQADGDRERVEDAVGVWALWRLADRIRDAHPDLA
jgi:hypothetical protein